MRHDGSGVAERHNSRKAYRKAMLKQKKAYWNGFLASAKKNDVWTAHQFTKIRVPNRVPGEDQSTPEAVEATIMSHFFPPGDNPAGATPPKQHETGYRGDAIAVAEISEILAKCSKKSAAGPDRLPYRVWKGIHSVNQNIIPGLVEEMLTWGIHPPMLKEATGVILPKPNKDNYTDCASFRVIALMQRLSKIAERVVAGRLTRIAYEKGLYSINQTGSLPHRSTVDAAVSLQHWIKEAQFARKKASSVFLDLKGGFDNVDYWKLMERLEGPIVVPEYLTNWIQILW